MKNMVSRRRVLEMSAATGSLAMLYGISPLLAKNLRRTPTQVLGPFYPVLKPLDQDADLTQIQGKSGRASGQVIHVTGRVIDSQGRPVKDARLEIWQANASGRYTHSSDKNPAPLDPNFDGFAVMSTDSQGRYRFKTIKPGAYPESPGVVRPPHIHFDVTGKVNRLVTQMYFPGEPLNDKDRVLQIAGKNRERLIASLLPPTQDLDPESLLAVWDIVLEEG